MLSHMTVRSVSTSLLECQHPILNSSYELATRSLHLTILRCFVKDRLCVTAHTRPLNPIHAVASWDVLTGRFFHHTDRPMRRESVSEPSRKPIRTGFATSQPVSSKSLWPSGYLWSPICASPEPIWTAISNNYEPGITIRYSTQQHAAIGFWGVSNHKQRLGFWGRSNRFRFERLWLEWFWFKRLRVHRLWVQQHRLKRIFHRQQYWIWELREPATTASSGRVPSDSFGIALWSKICLSFCAIVGDGKRRVLQSFRPSACRKLRAPR